MFLIIVTKLADETWAKLKILVDGMAMVRAVNAPELSKQISLAVKNSTLFK